MTKKHLISICIILGLIIIVFVLQIFLPKSKSIGKEMIFSIVKGEGSKEIALNLEKEGLITSASVFRIYVLTIGISGKLQAGKYELSPSMSIYEIAKKLDSGDIVTKNITIPEGFTIKQIEERLNTEMNMEMKIDSSFEGYLFPDTYLISYDANPQEILKMMQDNFEKKLTSDLRTEIERQNKTIKEIITMASLIEKEVISFEDKQTVSGIFWKRIKSGMPLDSCATIAYILGIDKWRYSYEDTRIQSPYNTYLNLGLPEGPICNPGLESIKAAIYPEASQFWFYLSAQNGETIFSKTLEEHNAAKVEYLY